MQGLPFYIPRIEMPQIDDSRACLNWLTEQGTAWRECHDVAPTTYRNHQHVAIDWQRARAIPDTVLDTPIMVSSDGYIVDGNHRWAIAKERGHKLTAYEVEATFGQCLTLLNAYPAVRHADGER